MYTGELSETGTIPGDTVSTRPVFHDFDDPCIYPGTLEVLQKAERKFCSLQTQTEHILTNLIQLVNSRVGNAAAEAESGTACIKSIQIDRCHQSTLLKFFVFLRFRNSAKYRELVGHLMEDRVLDVHSGSGWTSGKVRSREMPSVGTRPPRISELYSPLFRQVRCQAVLKSFIKFLEADFSHSSAYASADVGGHSYFFGKSGYAHPSTDPFEDVVDILNGQFPTSSERILGAVAADALRDPFQEVIDTYLWQFCQGAEVCLGLSEDQEFILPDSCFGILDEAFGWAGEETNPYV